MSGTCWSGKNECSNGYYCPVDVGWRYQYCLECNFSMPSNAKCKCNNTLQPSCKECNGDKCEDCIQNYYINGDKCEKCSDNCYYCDSSTECTLCDGGYYLENGSCKKCISPCESCISATECVQCPSGYYLSADNKCLSCSKDMPRGSRCVCRYTMQEGCAQCYNNDCQTCAKNYILVNQACKPTCTKQNDCLEGQYCDDNKYRSGQCYGCMDNCQKCIRADYCSLCNEGYYTAEDGTCKPCNNDMPSRSECHCAGKLIANCSRCSTTGCFRCIHDQATVKGQCLYNECTIDTQCISGEYCQSHTNIFNQCTKCDKSCETCTEQSNKCTKCFSGNYLTEKHGCAKLSENCLLAHPTGRCLKCASGFYINAQNNCSQLSQNCLQANMRGSCLVCENSYFITAQNTCQYCSKSMPIGSSCQCGNTKKTNCAQCDNNTCRTCIKGYSSINGDCKKDPCRDDAECKPNEFCPTSDPDATRFCRKCDKTCSTCRSDAKACTACESGKFLFQTKCETCKTGQPMDVSCQCGSKTIKNCIKCVGDACQMCADGMFLQDGKCISCSKLKLGEACAFQGKMVDNCKEYDSNQCSVCVNGAMAVNGVCKVCSENQELSGCSNKSVGKTVGIVVAVLVIIMLSIGVGIFVVKKVKRNNKKIEGLVSGEVTQGQVLKIGASSPQMRDQSDQNY
uniref:Cysteine-rich membrane protein 1 n=1 Tax=Spironucleus salmonicida TaxID=348837 RepID=V6M553_9EUKA|eukprot:EST48479.1 Cysteine-rich membrane protein 1 [Spironucleus salmonicida]